MGFYFFGLAWIEFSRLHVLRDKIYWPTEYRHVMTSSYHIVLPQDICVFFFSFYLWVQLCWAAQSTHS